VVAVLLGGLTVGALGGFAAGFIPVPILGGVIDCADLGTHPDYSTEVGFNGYPANRRRGGWLRSALTAWDNTTGNSDCLQRLLDLST
jgi:hypothetical protein